MIIKGTTLIPMDKNGVWQVKVFHLYGGFFKKFSKPGSFVKSSVKKTKINSIVLKKSKLKSIIILTKKFSFKNDLSFFSFKLNSCVLLKRRLTPVGKEILGPTLNTLKRKKFSYSFAGVL